LFLVATRSNEKITFLAIFLALYPKPEFLLGCLSSSNLGEISVPALTFCSRLLEVKQPAEGVVFSILPLLELFISTSHPPAKSQHYPRLDASLSSNLDSWHGELQYANRDRSFRFSKEVDDFRASLGPAARSLKLGFFSSKGAYQDSFGALRSQVALS
jgi:hypothetical protein